MIIHEIGFAISTFFVERPMFFTQESVKIHILKKRVFMDQTFELGPSVTQAIVKEKSQFIA